MIFLNESEIFKENNSKFVDLGEFGEVFKSAPYKMKLSGKPKKLAEIEKILSKYVNPKYNTIDAAYLATSRKDILQICKLFKEQFNFLGFYLNILQTEKLGPTFQVKPSGNILKDYFFPNIDWSSITLKPMGTLPFIPNAYTFGSTADVGRLLVAPPIRPFFSTIKEEKGEVSFKVPCQIGYVTAMPGLFHLLNPEEFIAIILHEIGHEFYQFNAIGFVLFLIRTILSIMTKYLNIGISFVTDALATAILDNPAGKYILSIITKVFAFLIGIANDIGAIRSAINVISIIFRFPKEVLKYDLIPSAIVSFFSGVVGEGISNELFADKFACMHGYAKGLSSSMLKMNENMKHSRAFRNTGIDIISEYLGNFLITLFAPFEGHPFDYSRIKNAFKACEQGVKNNPELTKALKSQQASILKDMQTYEKHFGKACAELVSTTDNVKASVASVIGDNYDKFINRATSVKSVKESFSNSSNIFLSEFSQNIFNNDEIEFIRKLDESITVEKLNELYRNTQKKIK